MLIDNSLGFKALPDFKCYLVLNVGGQQQILSVKNFQRYLLCLVLWPSKGQTLLERQVKMTCNQQPCISRF